MVAVMLQWEWKAGWQQLVEHIRDCCGSVKSVLLLDVVHVLASLKMNRLTSLSGLCNWGLNRGSVDDDGLRRVCTSDHLGSDHLKLLSCTGIWWISQVGVTIWIPPGGPATAPGCCI